MEKEQDILVTQELLNFIYNQSLKVLKSRSTKQEMDNFRDLFLDDDNGRVYIRACFEYYSCGSIDLEFDNIEIEELYTTDEELATKSKEHIEKIKKQEEEYRKRQEEYRKREELKRKEEEKEKRYKRYLQLKKEFE
jgi:FtsZ-interacting cell division protein YlmF